jgi:sugar phosphate isomerase/epimerase
LQPNHKRSGSASPSTPTKKKQGKMMKLNTFRTLWGVLKSTDGNLARSPHTQLEPALRHIKELGYDGVELTLKQVILSRLPSIFSLNKFTRAHKKC